MPDLTNLGIATMIAVLMLFILPKRKWLSIPGRLGDVAAGRQTYVLSPPIGQVTASGSAFHRFFWMFHAEWWRMFELGTPLYCVAVAVETYGMARSRQLVQRWRTSASGLMCVHLAGLLSTEDLVKQLRAQRLPLPMTKLPWEAPSQTTMPSISGAVQWRHELKARTAATAIPKAADLPTDGLPDAFPPALEIHTLGRIQLIDNGENLTPILLRLKARGFMWLYLMCCEILNPGVQSVRLDVGRVLAQPLDNAVQSRRVRQHLSEMKSLPSGLADRIRSTTKLVWFDASACQIDARRVLDLADEVDRAGQQVTDELLTRTEEAIPLAAGQFMPGWDRIAEEGTHGGEKPHELVGELRRLLDKAHVRLLDAAADCYLARHQAARAVVHLEDALRRHAGREDLAMKLVRAYEESGQKRNAARLKREYGID